MGYTSGRSGRTSHCRRCGEFVNPTEQDQAVTWWGVCMRCWLLENVSSRSLYESPELAPHQDEIDEALIQIYGLSNMCREWQGET